MHQRFGSSMSEPERQAVVAFLQQENTALRQGMEGERLPEILDECLRLYHAEDGGAPGRPMY